MRLPSSLSESPNVAEGLREFIDRSPLAIAIVEGGASSVLYANEAFSRLADGKVGSIVGRPVGEAIPGLDSPAIRTGLQRVRDTGTPCVDLEIETVGGHEGKSGGTCWSVSAWAIPDRLGQADHVLLQVRDVTSIVRERRDRHVMIEELRAINERLVLASLREAELTQQALAASEAKSVFLATMSHELRTPLAAIIGYGELLADGITDPVTDAQRLQLGRIKASAAHLLALIDEVLTFARVEAKGETVDRNRVNAVELVTLATTLVAPLAAAKRLSLVVRPPRESLNLATDSLKVRQIVVNLLTNAIKFTERGEVLLTVEEDGGWVAFTVRDSGIGIAAENLDRVFDPFWQVEQKATRKVGGAGLGLSVSRRLARLLGGDVTVESSPGDGSTFTLRLPISDQQ